MSEPTLILSVECLVITESHLDKTIPQSLLAIPGFHGPVRQDRPVNGRIGGGCLVYVAEHLAFEQVGQFEHIWVDIKANKTIHTVNAWHRPPNDDSNTT